MQSGSLPSQGLKLNDGYLLVILFVSLTSHPHLPSESLPSFCIANCILWGCRLASSCLSVMNSARRRLGCTKKKSGCEFPAPFPSCVPLMHLCTDIAAVEWSLDNTASSGLCLQVTLPSTLAHFGFMLSLVCRYFSFFLSSLGSSIYA